MSTPPLSGGVPYLEQLMHCPRRLELARAELGTLLNDYLEAGYVRQVESVLGSLITLDTQGLRELGFMCRPLSCATVTDQLAAHEAYALAKARGYQPVFVSRNYLRLSDTEGREHLLYVRISSGLPSSATIRTLLKKHAPSLRRTGGSLIFYVLRDPNYKGRAKAIQFWEVTNNPP